MREIKFRAWDKRDEEFKYFEPIYGLFAQLRMSEEVYGQGKDNYIIQQYTGLKDKNGKEIYEGDIVKVFPTFIDGDTQKVWWGEKIYGFTFGGYALPQITFDKTFEIIGNIYENKEVLK